MNAAHFQSFYIIYRDRYQIELFVVIDRKRFKKNKWEWNSFVKVPIWLKEKQVAHTLEQGLKYHVHYLFWSQSRNLDLFSRCDNILVNFSRFLNFNFTVEISAVEVTAVEMSGSRGPRSRVGTHKDIQHPAVISRFRYFAIFTIYPNKKFFVRKA